VAVGDGDRLIDAVTEGDGDADTSGFEKQLS
jgi:hypothetical protein